ncbi:hypothetical protein B0T25DRAFT_195475 [Lasiosphaeria hispida]|uniref:Uncharacterized protein n=1 Tax=Lasiosphaeria hispida TaxID=260671 RepID=A0AAJ0HHL9_9PEZI|nr:hypothetical protein B0T25DRAFT_195475 [Lasiosphaeria hispida]
MLSYGVWSEAGDRLRSLSRLIWPHNGLVLACLFAGDRNGNICRGIGSTGGLARAFGPFSLLETDTRGVDGRYAVSPSVDFCSTKHKVGKGTGHLPTLACESETTGPPSRIHRNHRMPRPHPISPPCDLHNGRISDHSSSSVENKQGLFGHSGILACCRVSEMRDNQDLTAAYYESHPVASQQPGRTMEFGLEWGKRHGSRQGSGFSIDLSPGVDMHGRKMASGLVPTS